MDYNDIRFNSFSSNYHLYTFQTQPPVPQPQSHTQQTSYNGTYGMSQSDNGPPVPKQQDSSTTTITVPSVSTKVINPDKKSESKLFILRNVELSSIETPENMRSLLIEKLGQDLVAKEPGIFLE